MYILVLQRLFLEAIVDIFYFPLWWYTGGVAHAANKCWHWFLDGNSILAPGLWLHNIFVPMFGQYDFQGRVISFVMRLVQVVARSFALSVWLMVCVMLFMLWMVFPVIILYGLFISLGVV